MPDSNSISNARTMVLQASELLGQSTLLLERIIRISMDGTTSAHQVVNSIKNLSERPKEQLASPGGRLLYGAKLLFAGLRANAAAQQAARAALDVRELIGGADASPIHGLQPLQTSALTLHQVQDLLCHLSDAAWQQSAAWKMNAGEAEAIRNYIAAMADAAKRNRIIATKAARAIEVLLSQATNFTRVAKTSKLALWR